MDYISYIRESIHLVNLAGKIPIDEFNKTAVLAFEKLKSEIFEEIEKALSSLEITKDGIDMSRAGLRVPSSTWTYLINDRPEQVGINPMSRNPIAAAINIPLWAGAALYYRFSKKANRLK